MPGIIIDAAKCIGCGECAADCVANHIALADGRAQVREGTHCIECGHCYAICPVKAVDMPGYETGGLEETADMREFDPDRLLLAMESRRSIRRFTPEPVGEADLGRLLAAGRFAPTGSNSQSVHFVVLRERLAEAEAAALKEFKKVKKLADIVSRTARQTELGEHFFFKGAPLAIVCAGRRDVDASLAAAYIELLAESMGLGVLYSGYFVYAAKHSCELKRLLSLPAGIEPAATLVIGHTDVKYARRAPRRPINLIMR